MSENNKAILEKANVAVEKGDYEGFLLLCTEDTEWTFVGDQVLRGKEAVRQWMSTTYKEPPQFDVAQFISDGDFLTALGEITTTDDSGRAVRSSYCDVWRFRDGKMAQLTAFVIEIPDDAAAATEVS